jgi:hypothetical protein
MKRCPICGVEGQACGGPTSMPGVDERVSSLAPQGVLARYVIPNGDGTTYELLLDPQHAALIPGATPVT